MRAAPRSLPAIACLLVLAACGPDAETERRLARLYALTAEKDSLLVQVAENARLMSDIGAEIARVQGPTAAGEAGVPLAITRDSLLAGVHALTNRLLETEARLVESEQRVAALTVADSADDAFRTTIADLRATVDNQKRTIASLTSQIESLRTENVRLTEQNVALSASVDTLSTTNVALEEENLALADTVSRLAERDNAAYYVIGSKDDLLRRGIIEEQGGSRVLFVFGKRGKTIVPARSLDPQQFVLIDKRTFREIPIEAEKEYAVVSRQDVSALEAPPGEDGIVTGAARIADPDRFWTGGRFLILVER